MTVDEDFRVRFLKEYVDLIGVLSAANPGRLWWATDIASKNRFCSRIPELLQQFLETPRSTGHLALRDWVQACRRFFSVFYHAFVFTGRMLYARIQLCTALRSRLGPGRSYYVVKTFIYDHSFASDGRYTDIFFGSLPEALKGKQPVLILGQVLGGYKQCIRKIKDCPDFLIIPVEFFVSGADILRAVKDIVLFRPRVPKELKFFQYPVAQTVAREFFRTYKGIQIYQLLHYACTARLLKTVKIATFLLTYENNPWEKMCIMALKERSAQTKIIGYQHTVVPQASANMFTSRLEEDIIPKPDMVLTVGEKPKEIIHRYETCHPSTIEPACGLRFEHLFGQPQSARTGHGHILLALEGLPQVAEMVDYVLRELGNDNQYRIRIRTHPVLPLDKIAGQLSQDPWQMANVEISQGKALSEDLSWADMVIYWGTTVALEALSIGKPVIHYDTGSVLSYDPLFELKDFKWVACRSVRLADIIKEIHGLPDAVYEVRRRAAQGYIAAYFYPVTPEAMRRFGA